MVFSSPIFLFMFLPIFLGIYYAVPTRWKSLVILLGSCFFYGWWRADFLILFFGLKFYSYTISRHLAKLEDGTLRRNWMLLGVAGNIAVLSYFKYFNFGLDSFNSIITSAGMPMWEGWKVILPIGISFYTFQSLSYVIDVYRRDAKPAKNFIDFAAFVALFPQLIAGPVLRYKDLEHQFHNRTHSWEKFNEGALRFAVGFSKKILIADSLAPLADASFAMQDPSFFDAWLGILAYAAQLYFDFSGYSDMAIGIGLMMGFRFVENFNHPYISRSITEFWRRWHISLSTWLRDYLYISLGGNRKGNFRTYLNLFLTMMLGGLWHGANFTFLLWGMWHGAMLALERYLGGKSGSPYPRLIAWPLTFFSVLMGWVLFRAPTLEVAGEMYGGLFGFHGMGISESLIWATTPLQIGMLGLAYIVMFTAPRIMRDVPVIPGELKPSWVYGLQLKYQIALMVLLLLSVSKMVAQSFSPFLYFQF